MCLCLHAFVSKVEYYRLLDFVNMMFRFYYLAESPSPYKKNSFMSHKYNLDAVFTIPIKKFAYLAAYFLPWRNL